MGAKATVVDFSGVKERGAFNPRRVAEGDYAAIVTKVEDATAKESGNAMYVFTVKPMKYSQNTYPYRCVITENQLWKLRNLATAAGLSVPKKRMKFDPNKIVGKRIGITLIDDEYEKDGKTQLKSEIDAVFPISELADLTGVADEGSEEDEQDGPQLASDEDYGDGAVDEAEPAAEPKKGKKDKKAKKSKKKGSDEENLEDLDLNDIG